MEEIKNFQARAQGIGELVAGIERIADPAAHAAAKALVQSVMDLHSTAIERMLEIIFQSGEAGGRMIEQLALDPLVSSLLILYGLHPDDLENRLRRKLDQIASRLRKLGASAMLTGVCDGIVHVRLSRDGHACCSTTHSLRELVEGELYDAAPDLASLTIEGLDEPSASGFVGLERLVGPGVSTPHEPLPSHSARGETA